MTCCSRRNVEVRHLLRLLTPSTQSALFFDGNRQIADGSSSLKWWVPRDVTGKPIFRSPVGISGRTEYCFFNESFGAKPIYT